MSTTTTTTTTEKKKAKRAEQVTMEDAIQQLVELAKGYVSYTRKSLRGTDDYFSFRDEDVFGRVSFVYELWFVGLGDVEVTTNCHKITFPYSYTINDLVKTCTLYTSYLDKLNTDLSNKSKEEVEAERRAEIERLKSKLAELEVGK